MTQIRSPLGGSGSDGGDGGRAGEHVDGVTTHGSRDDAFDRAMHGLHAQALGAVSARTQARLRATRTAATLATDHAPARGFGWVLGSGLAALFALAIGLQFSGAPTTTTSPVQTASIDSSSGIAVENADGGVGQREGDEPGFATLDENPDFYLWLASNDDAMPAQWER